MRSVAAAFALLCAGVSAAWAQTPAERDWAAVTAADAQAFHDALLDSHPGPYDPINPGFSAQLDAGLAVALRRAAHVSDYAGLVWTLREYAASFDDGHVAVIATGEALPSRWPGFLVRYTAQGFVVASRADDADAAPPLGARLVSCDGVRADRLAADRVGRVRGRWSMESTRVMHSWRLFVDQGDPFAPPMRRCRFASDGRTRSYTLTWAPVENTVLAPFISQSQARAQPGIGVRTYGENGYWISLGSFDGSPNSDSARQLSALMTELEGMQAQLRAAHVVVLDIRGNNGGSSIWGDMVAKMLWGEDVVESRNANVGVYVDWRASQGNLTSLQEVRAEWANDPSAQAEAMAWADNIIAGMTDAIAHDQPYWREEDPPGTVAPTPLPIPPSPHVVAIADSGCGSACLDALDVWRAMGATQVGAVTSGDTVYMDVRHQALPSGLSEAVIPMKVYRGRVRGHNQPYEPHHPFGGDLTDTAALEAWIVTLPELQAP